MKQFYFILIFLIPLSVISQKISLYDQFNGRYDYVGIGNTLNTEENNNPTSPCSINTSSSATLNLNTSQTIKAAYLYWAGSGTGDLNVTLNNQNLTADRNFIVNLNNLDFFAAFKDVTTILQATGNGTYTLSNLDLNSVITNNSAYCNTATNFGGWSIIIVYEDPSLPLNQLSIYDGLEGVSSSNLNLNINLTNINVIDNIGAKIGFLAWEGDQSLYYGEDLLVNGNLISNPPLNPLGNAFNGTNSFTNSSTSYNMDLDVYNVENNINIGDTTANIQLTTGDLDENGIFRADLIIINNIVTVFNSVLPDPAPVIDLVDVFCESRDIEVNYTVTNINCTDELPANTVILFYADNLLVGQTNTNNIIAIGGSESGQITLSIPASIANTFTLSMVVNDDGNGNTIIQEINPDNNETNTQVQLINPVAAVTPLDFEECDDASNDGISSFDFSSNTSLVIGSQTDVSVSYYELLSDAENAINPITNTNNYQNITNPQEIFIRIESTKDSDCYITTSFFLTIHYLPVIGDPEDLILCDDFSNDEIATFNLNDNDILLENNQPNSALTYHLTQNDADINQNNITNLSAFENTTNPQTIYARLENEDHPECYTTASFLLIINAIENLEIPETIINCDEGFNLASFDLTEIEEFIPLTNSEVIENYYVTATDASFLNNPITNPINYYSVSDPQQIFVRVEEQDACYKIYSFNIGVENCPPFIPEGFSPNDDTVNDTFHISGLYNIFEKFQLKIYNRYGNLIYEGNNNTPEWDGKSTRGLTNEGKQLPTGTYYYILDLKDSNYQVYKSWVYLNR
ncbi:gliding motility-associated C-terminal domain-containing protein [Mesonia phycicola]|uniref:Gliding motility-associated C-terminal domain-containing protein n=1 Tax=Mesonia phycicola TaxID=579105 RepID=A0A1M6DYQ4_9FLAO|nr:gliding motility-associated C-terminal domain-containing protein [Mesonia phycicola]SHI78321.1 gliding motility-associated C-terminal domain-containing protein [Mesonia phycicola]